MEPLPGSSDRVMYESTEINYFPCISGSTFSKKSIIELHV